MVTLLAPILALSLVACGGGDAGSGEAGAEPIVLTVEPTHFPAASGGEPDRPTPAPEATPPPAPSPAPSPVSIAAALAEIDAQLSRTMAGSIAHNAPESVMLDDMVEVQLLISPSAAPAELAAAIGAPGPVVADVLQITPWMRAELISLNPEAFSISPRHADPEQPLSNIEATEWKWALQAREPGRQRLLLTVYRLVELEDRDYWRKVEEYQHEMTVDVTVGNRLAALWERLTANLLYPVSVALLVAAITWLAGRLWQRRSAG